MNKVYLLFILFALSANAYSGWGLPSVTKYPRTFTPVGCNDTAAHGQEITPYANYLTSFGLYNRPEVNVPKIEFCDQLKSCYATLGETKSNCDTNFVEYGTKLCQDKYGYSSACNNAVQMYAATVVKSSNSKNSFDYEQSKSRSYFAAYASLVNWYYDNNYDFEPVSWDKVPHILVAVRNVTSKLWTKRKNFNLNTDGSVVHDNIELWRVIHNLNLNEAGWKDRVDEAVSLTSSISSRALEDNGYPISPTMDGCSVEIDLLDELDFDDTFAILNIFRTKPEFEEACDRHDVAYSILGIDKSTTDYQFKADLQSACSHAYPGAYGNLGTFKSAQAAVYPSSQSLARGWLSDRYDYFFGGGLEDDLIHISEAALEEIFSELVDPVSYAACIIVSEAMYQALRLLGRPAYDTAQFETKERIHNYANRFAIFRDFSRFNFPFVNTAPIIQNSDMEEVVQAVSEHILGKALLSNWMLWNAIYHADVRTSGWQSRLPEAVKQMDLSWATPIDPN